MARRFLCRLGSLGALWVLGAGGTAALAQDSGAPPPPPRFVYGDAKIALIEAVRLTLAHDPNLLLQKEDVRAQQGIFQEQSGAFDWNLSGTLSYDYREQELRNSAIQREVDKREELEQLGDFVCDSASAEAAKIPRLEQALGGAFDVAIPQDIALEAQIRFIETLIRTSGSPAEIAALSQSRQATIARALAESRVRARDLADSCVDVRADRARLGAVPEFEEFAKGKFDLRLEKLTRGGLSLSPFQEASYEHTQLKGKRNGFFEPRLDANGQQITTEFGTPILKFVDFGGKNIEDLYRVEVGFDVNVPFLRGRGKDWAAAPERAAGIDLAATELALQHGASVSALNTTIAYWNLLAAQERVAVLTHSVELQTRLTGITDELIAGDVVPRIERSRSLASLANARAQADGAARDLVSARLALARAMGIDVASEANAPLAEGPFPGTPSAEAVTAVDAATLAARALERRRDRQASLTLVDSGRVLANAAKLDLRDRLDASASVSAGALGEQDFGEAVDRWTGPNASVGLAYEKLVGNRTRLGRLSQREAQLNQRQISVADLDRTIRIGVVQTLRSLEEAVGRLEQAEAAAGYFQETVDGEFEKLGLGASTLLDAILTEQQKTSGDLGVIAARQQVAVLLAQLRFESGTMVEPAESGAGGTFTLDDLTTLPQGGS
jgi:outer membrane protein TolC